MSEGNGNGDFRRTMMGVYRAVMVAGILGIGGFLLDARDKITTLVVKVEVYERDMARMERRVDRLERRFGAESP